MPPVFYTPETEYVLITPNEITEGVQIKDRTKNCRNLAGEVENGHDIHSDKTKYLYKIFKISKIYTFSHSL
jgi:hypothetical protein